MFVRTLSAEETAQNGFTHVARVTYQDLAALGGSTSGTLTVMSGLGKGWFVDAAYFKLVTAFDGGATSSLKLDFGYDLASGTDDEDAFLDNYEVHLDGTEILAGDGNGAVFAANRTGYAFQEAADLELLFTATGGNLNALTQGEVLVFWSAKNTNDIEA